jgi:hypothetical protein
VGLTYEWKRETSFNERAQTVMVGLFLEGVNGLNASIKRLVPELDLNQSFIKIDNDIKINDFDATQLYYGSNNIMTVYLLIDKMNQVYAKFRPTD